MREKVKAKASARVSVKVKGRWHGGMVAWCCGGHSAVLQLDMVL